MTEMQRAVLTMTPDQVLASWTREQLYRRERGLTYYSVLRDVVTGKVVARVEPEARQS